MIALAGAGLVAVLAQVGPPAPEPPRAQTVFVAWEGKACLPQVNGVETGPVSTEEGKAALLAALPDKGAPLRLLAKAGGDIPYDCAADILATLRHAGYYGHVGLNTE